MTLLKWWDF